MRSMCKATMLINTSSNQDTHASAQTCKRPVVRSVLHFLHPMDMMDWL